MAFLIVAFWNSTLKGFFFDKNYVIMMESLIKRTFLFQSLKKVCLSLLKLSGYLSIIEGEIKTMILAGSTGDLLKLLNSVSYFLDYVFLNYIKSKLLFSLFRILGTGSLIQQTFHLFNKQYYYENGEREQIEEVSICPFILAVLGILPKRGPYLA